jgi:T4 superinfection immunity protein
MQERELFYFFLVIIGVVCLYFLPSWVAGHRQHRNFNAIFVLNILLARVYGEPLFENPQLQ